MGILDNMSSDGFQETSDDLLNFEARSGITSAARRASKNRNPHRMMRHSCMKCGKIHTAAEHKSHGSGSYARTH